MFLLSIIWGRSYIGSTFRNLYSTSTFSHPLTAKSIHLRLYNSFFRDITTLILLHPPHHLIYIMSFCIAVPEFNHNAVPVTQPTCSYCGIHLRHVQQSAGSSKVIGNIATYTASSAYVSPWQPSPVHDVVIDSENDLTEGSPAAMHSGPMSITRISAVQKEKNRFSTFDKNRKAVDTTLADVTV